MEGPIFMFTYGRIIFLDIFLPHLEIEIGVFCSDRRVRKPPRDPVGT
jgi:hypothetical protein